MQDELLLTHAVPEWYKEEYEPGDVCWPTGDIFMEDTYSTHSEGGILNESGYMVPQGVEVPVRVRRAISCGEVAVSAEQGALASRYGWEFLGITENGLHRMRK